MGCLTEKGWRIKPKPHFHYIGTHLEYPDVKADVEAYLAFWKKEIKRIKQYGRSEFNDVYELLIADYGGRGVGEERRISDGSPRRDP